MSKHVCVICYQKLPRAQKTCGSLECTDAWRNIRGRDARLKRSNLATLSPSERALITAQTEPEPTQEIIDLLTTAQPDPAGDKFLRSFLAPTSAPIKKGGD